MDQNKLSELLITANRARDNAYAPYSQYRVGCAVLLREGTVIKGGKY
jgi:cytidine deaminase